VRNSSCLLPYQTYSTLSEHLRFPRIAILYRLPNSRPNLGWAGRTRTFECQRPKPVPYQLATVPARSDSKLEVSELSSFFAIILQADRLPKRSRATSRMPVTGNCDVIDAVFAVNRAPARDHAPEVMHSRSTASPSSTLSLRPRSQMARGAYLLHACSASSVNRTPEDAPAADICATRAPDSSSNL